MSSPSEHEERSSDTSQSSKTSSSSVSDSDVDLQVNSSSSHGSPKSQGVEGSPASANPHGDGADRSPAPMETQPPESDGSPATPAPPPTEPQQPPESGNDAASSPPPAEPQSPENERAATPRLQQPNIDPIPDRNASVNVQREPSTSNSSPKEDANMGASQRSQQGQVLGVHGDGRDRGINSPLPTGQLEEVVSEGNQPQQAMPEEYPSDENHPVDGDREPLNPQYISIRVQSHVASITHTKVVQIKEDDRVELILREYLDGISAGQCHAFTYMYCFKDERGHVIRNNEKISETSVKDGETIFLSVVHAKKFKLPFSWCAFAAVTTGVLFLFLIGILCLWTIFLPLETDVYTVLVDAGSMHTTVYTYSYRPRTDDLSEVHRCSLGLTSIAEHEENPHRAWDLLNSACLNESIAMIPIDSTSRSSAKIEVASTGGLRIIQIKNPEAAEMIVDSITTGLRTLADGDIPFTVNVLDGKEEAMMSWLSANYLMGRLNSPPWFSMSTNFTGQTVGAMDWGGASLQRTQLHQDFRDANYSMVVMNGTGQNLETLSFMCYGQRESLNRHMGSLVYRKFLESGRKLPSSVADPCSPADSKVTKGFNELFTHCCNQLKDEEFMKMAKQSNSDVTFLGTGDIKSCSQTVKEVMNYQLCTSRFKDMDDEESCMDPAKILPPLGQKFYAFSIFYYLVQGFNLPAIHWLSTFDYTLEKVCSFKRAELAEMGLGPESDYACFSGMMMRTILVDGFHFNNITYSNIEFVKDLKGVELGWTVGYVLYNLQESQIRPWAETVVRRFGFTCVVIGALIFFTLFVTFSRMTITRRNQHNQYRRLAAPDSSSA